MKVAMIATDESAATTGPPQQYQEDLMDVIDNGEDDDEDDQPDPADLLMSRGSLLRQLRELERQDNEARLLSSGAGDPDDQYIKASTVGINDGESHFITDGTLNYESYLVHQRYYDDLKHIDYKFIDFGLSRINNASCDGAEGRKSKDTPLIVEQDKTLGKGGLCWDAAFCLGEHLIQTQNEWLSGVNHSQDDNNSGSQNQNKVVTVVELGCGTGLCGMMVAKAIPGVSVYLTDLPNLMPLVQRNIQRNFELDQIFSAQCKTVPNTTGNENELVNTDTDSSMPSLSASSSTSSLTSSLSASSSSSQEPSNLSENGGDNKETTHLLCALSNNCRAAGVVTNFSLNWDDVATGRHKIDTAKESMRNCNDDNKQIKEERCQGHHPDMFDVVIGADVVATLYNPTALAQTVYAVAKNKKSIVFISFKERLSSIHRQFETELQNLFHHVQIVPAASVKSRNHNPDIGILIARGKKENILE